MSPRDASTLALQGYFFNYKLYCFVIFLHILLSNRSSEEGNIARHSHTNSSCRSVWCSVAQHGLWVHPECWRVSSPSDFPWSWVGALMVNNLSLHVSPSLVTLTSKRAHGMGETFFSFTLTHLIVIFFLSIFCAQIKRLAWEKTLRTKKIETPICSCAAWSRSRRHC